MKCCDITTRDLKSLITIERNVTTVGANGSLRDNWTADPAGGIWCKWTAIPAAMENITKGQRDWLTNQGMYEAVIRFRGDVHGAPYYTAKDRVIFRDREYNIRGVYDVDDAQTWLVLNLTLGTLS